MKPSISIVVPNRNDSKFLSKCLDSILEQSVHADQLVVVDDQSTDNSLSIIRNTLQDIPGALILQNRECLGTMGALNEGLKHSNSDYVLFLSSNDFIENNLVERAKLAIEKGDFPGVWSALVWEVDGKGNRIRLYPSPAITFSDAKILPKKCIGLAATTGHWFTGTTLMYRRDALLKIGGFNSAYGGLADMVAALTIASTDGAVFSPEPLSVIRRHSEGLMWRTLTDLHRLDAILEQIWLDGAAISPELFKPTFCDLMARRIRLTAIRAHLDEAWLEHSNLWQGNRYRLLGTLALLPRGKWRSLKLLLAFLALRPPQDIVSILWFRYFKLLCVRVRMWVGSTKLAKGVSEILCVRRG